MLTHLNPKGRSIRKLVEGNLNTARTAASGVNQAVEEGRSTPFGFKYNRFSFFTGFRGMIPQQFRKVFTNTLSENIGIRKSLGKKEIGRRKKPGGEGGIRPQRFCKSS
jgi:hypothetical protein